MATARRPDRDPTSPSTSSAWRRPSSPRTPGRCGSTRTRAWSARRARRPTSACTREEDIRRILWIRHLTRDRGVNLAGVRTLFELEERLGKRILEALYDEGTREQAAEAAAPSGRQGRQRLCGSRRRRRFGAARDREPHPPDTTHPNRIADPAAGTQGDPDGQATVRPRSTKPEPEPATPELRELPLVALRETVIFPEMIVPLQVGREKSVAALNAAVESERPDRARDPAPGRAGGHRATRPSCTRSAPSPRSPRSCSSRTAPSGPSSRARAASASTASARPGRTSPRASRSSRTRRPRASRSRRSCAASRRRSSSTSRTARPVPPEAAVAARNITEPGLPRRHGRVQPRHVDRAAPGAARDDRRRSSGSSSSRAFLARQIEILELKGKIQSEVKSEMDKTQREYILREQLKAIQRELGEDDPQQAEINELREKVEAVRHAGGGPRPGDQGDRPDEPDPVRLARGRRHPDLRGLARRRCRGTSRRDDQLDIKEAAQILDEDHYGLEKIKERILEYLAVRTLADTIRSPILAVRRARPASARRRWARSIAKAMGRKFVRMSLGGIHDEAEIRGHRRTYIGALPGRIIQNIKTGGHEQPGVHARRGRQDRHGLPGRPVAPRCSRCSTRSRTTPSRTTTWRCRSTCARCCSSRPANLLDPIPAAAARPDGDHPAAGLHPAGEDRDRAAGSSSPSRWRTTASRPSTSRSPTRSSMALVQAYTKEAGVRNLERELANIMRKVARSVAEGRKRKTVVDLQEARGVPRPAALRVRRAGGRGPDRVRDGPRRDRGRRRRRRGRGHEDGGQGGLHPHRPAGRRDARVRSRGAVLDPGERRRSSASRARSSRRTPSTSTSRPAPSPRTARRPA